MVMIPFMKCSIIQIHPDEDTFLDTIYLLHDCFCLFFNMISIKHSAKTKVI